MTEKLSYEDFKSAMKTDLVFWRSQALRLAQLLEEAKDDPILAPQLEERLHDVLQSVMRLYASQTASTYDEYCLSWENNKREKTKFPQELSDLLDLQFHTASTSNSCKILPTFNKDKEGDLSISICFNEISVILNDNGTWHYSKPTNN